MPEKSAVWAYTPYTLFARAGDDEPLFQRALEQYFGGEPDPLTIEALCVKS